MQKDKKSQKDRIQKLRMILDLDSNKDIHPEDEKYLKTLSRRLKETSNRSIVYARSVSKDKGEREAYSLEPRVVIHPRVEKKVIEIPKIKEEKKVYEEEEIFEVEKVELPRPEFIEVKPKLTEKEEKED